MLVLSNEVRYLINHISNICIIDTLRQFPRKWLFCYLEYTGLNNALFTKVSVIFQVKFATLDVNIDVVHFQNLNKLR